MKVKIGNKFYDSNDEPIMLILTPQEKHCIGDMGEQIKFLSFPNTGKDNLDKMKEFMRDENEVQEDYFKNKEI